MLFLIWYAHPGDMNRYEYSTAPSITLGTLCKLYTALRAKQTNRCWSYYRFLWLVPIQPLMKGQGPDGAETEREQVLSIKTHQERSPIPYRRLDMEKWLALFSFPLFRTAFVSISHGIKEHVVQWRLVGDLFLVLQTDWKNIKGDMLRKRVDVIFNSLQHLQEDYFVSSCHWKQSTVHKSWGKNDHIFAFHFLNFLPSSFCGSSRAVHVKTSTPVTHHCVCTPFSTNQA